MKRVAFFSSFRQCFWHSGAHPNSLVSAPAAPLRAHALYRVGLVRGFVICLQAMITVDWCKSASVGSSEAPLLAEPALQLHGYISHRSTV
jgi:hypothetical protein